MRRFYYPHDPIIGDLKERFWKKVDILDGFATDEDCWLWTAATDTKGYGIIHFKRKQYLAHRISYWIYKQYCQSNLLRTPEICVLHRCDSPACINPSHLFLGTVADNNKDMYNKKRSHNQNITHCPSGHEYTEKNTYINSYGGRICRKCGSIRSRKA